MAKGSPNKPMASAGWNSEGPGNSFSSNKPASKRNAGMKKPKGKGYPKKPRY